MQKTVKTDLANDFASVLGCQPKYVQRRLIALGHKQTCGRCGGGGQYSYCQAYGTTCFGCGGSGMVATKLSQNLLATVTTQVAAGELDAYISELKARAKVNGFMNQFFAAWEANPSVAAGKDKHHTKMSDRENSINQYVSPLLSEARKLVSLIKDGEWDKAGRKYVPVSTERQDTAAARLDAILCLVQQAETLAPNVARRGAK